MKNIILTPLKPYKEEDMEDPLNRLPWEILIKIGKLNYQKYLSKACKVWKRENLIK